MTTPSLHPSSHFPSSRREFLGRAAAAGAGLALAGAAPLAYAAAPTKGANKRFKITGFTKPFQYLNYDDTADLVAEVGWDGVELALRKGGHVLPERVEDDLPKLVEALKKRNLEVLTIATDIHNATDPLTEKVLRAAAKSGIKLYRLAHLQYDLSKPIPPQVANVLAGLRELRQLNTELGLVAAYENHSGKSSVGAPLWDLWTMLQDLRPEHYGVCFDIAHATVEGGLDWAIQFSLLEGYLRAIYVKDFLWTKKATGSGLLIPWKKGGTDRFEDHAQVGSRELGFRGGQFGAEVFEGGVLKGAAQAVYPDGQGLLVRGWAQVRGAGENLARQ